MLSRHSSKGDRSLTRRSLVSASGAGIALAMAGSAQPSSLFAQATPESQADLAFSSDDQLIFHEIVESVLASTATPGALVSVRYPGRGVWRHAAGIGDIANGAPVTLDDHVRIASNTKTFVATVVLQLVEEGLLSLDDPLENYIPGVPNGTEITIRQVLGMRAGIYDFINDPLISETYLEDPLLTFGPEEALAIIRGGTPNFAPDERVQYSNSNYILLGLIIEQLTGRSIAEEVQHRILTPLNLTRTSFPIATPEIPAPAMHGYLVTEADDDLRDVTHSNPDVPWASGAMISTLADLEIWIDALATGSLLSEESHKERLSFKAIQEEPIAVSYGLGILSLNGFIGHNGGIFGYSSWAMYEPESGASIVVVTNRSGTEGGTSDEIFLQIAVTLFPDKFPGLVHASEHNR